VLGEENGTAYRGDRGKTAYDHSQDTTTNPHAVTKAQVGLGSVDNVSQASLDTRYGRVASPSGDATGVADTAVIMAALAALPSAKGRVLLQPGTYIVTGGGLTLDTGQWLEGHGVEATVLKLANSSPGSVLATKNFSTLTGGTSTASPYNCGWSNLTIDGNAANQAVTAPTQPPVISSVVTVGTAGTSLYTYIATAIGAGGGESVWSALGAIATGNATLNGTNYNTITLSSAPANGWNLYRCPTAGGSQICNMQRVNSTPIAGTTFNDQGAALQATKAPYGDTTVAPTVAVYAYGFKARDFVIRNGAGTGLWTEWSTQSTSPGNDSMEAFLSNYKIHDCAGDGWVHIGPHDTQSVNAIIFKNGSGGAIGWCGIRVPSSNGAANGSVISHTHVWGGTYQYGVYVGGSGIRLADHITEGGTSAQLWIDAAQVQVSEAFLYTGGVSTASARGVILGSQGNVISGCWFTGEINNCGGGAFDFTYGGDHNKVIAQHYYYSGTTPTGSTLGVISTPTAKNFINLTVTNNGFLIDVSTLNQQPGPVKVFRTNAVATDTRDLIALLDESSNLLFRVDSRGRIRSQGLAAGQTPTVAIGAAIGTSGNGAAVSLTNASDLSGTLTITTASSGVASGTLASITFTGAFGGNAKAVFYPKDAASAALATFNGTSTTAASIKTAATPAISTTYTFDYIVIG